MSRALAAFALVILLFAALLWLLGFDRSSGGLTAIAQATAIAFGCGLPTLIWFCKCQWWQLWRFLAGGMLGGMLCALPFLDGGLAPPALLTVFAVLGLGHAWLFWLLAVWRNRNLTCPAFFRLPDGARYPVARSVRLEVEHP